MDLIETTHDLAEALAACRAGGVLALDTEFFWERTYHPALGLVQFADAEGNAYLLDAVALKDWSPLKAALEDPDWIKILHDAQQDLTILRLACGADPVRIFDTRLAAGFAGLPSTISLHKLLDTLLEVHLEKDQTRTDWLRRPLSEKQLEYAADDVRYLARARTELLAIIDASGHREKLREELATLDDPALYQDRDPRAAYLRFKSLGKCKPVELAILREVSAWREEQAARKNRPRRHILPDGVLFGIAKVKPETPGALKNVRDFPARALRSIGDPLLEAVQTGLTLEPTAHPTPPKQPPKEVKDRAGRILTILEERCEPLGLDPALVCSRAELTRLLQEDAPEPVSHRLLRGWRAELIGEEILGADEVGDPTPQATE